jgi:alcohol dehydrogenase (cytochrome c)
MLTTAGTLLFAGDAAGNIVGYDATNGDPVWHAFLGALVSNAPETYALDGHQYLLVAAGDTVWSFALPQRERH